MISVYPLSLLIVPSVFKTALETFAPGLLK